MIIPLLVFLLILIAVSLSLWALFAFLPDYLKERNLNITQDILSHEEKDIVFSRENAVISKDLRAVVRCNPERKVVKRGFFYDDVRDCRLFKEIYESDSECSYGCIGFGSCVNYCPQDAISIKNGTAVINSNCSGCGLCVDTCPNGLIQLIPKEQTHYVACASIGSNEHIKEICSTACTNCENCQKDAVTEEDAQKCPSGCILSYEKKPAKDFKFWQLCYNILTAQSTKTAKRD